MRSATTPVQPVWWVAPSPAPLSPWKYSLKSRLSFHAGSLCRRSTPPKHGRRPSAPPRNSETSRWRRSSAISSSVRSLPRAGRVLDLELVAEEAVVALEGADDEVVEREPQRAPPVRVAAEHVRRRLGRLVVDRGRGRPRRRARRGARGGRPTGPAARTARGTRPRRTACSNSRGGGRRRRRRAAAARRPGSPPQQALLDGVSSVAEVVEEPGELLAEGLGPGQHGSRRRRPRRAAG